MPFRSCQQKCGRKRSLPWPGDVFAAPTGLGGFPGPGPLPYLDDDIALLDVDDETGEPATP